MAKEETTAFDHLKKIEEVKKKQLMAKILTKIKELAKDIQENKELCNLYLDEISTDEKEKKQIIDWINNLSDVKPDDERMAELRDKAKGKFKEDKKTIEREVETKYWPNAQTFANVATLGGTYTGGLTNRTVGGQALNVATAHFNNTSNGISASV